MGSTRSLNSVDRVGVVVIEGKTADMAKNLFYTTRLI